MTTICRVCNEPIEEYPDAVSGGWTHVDIDAELTTGHAAAPVGSVERSRRHPGHSSRVIRVDDEVYAAIQRARRPGESIQAAVTRLVSDGGLV